MPQRLKAEWFLLEKQPWSHCDGCEQADFLSLSLIVSCPYILPDAPWLHACQGPALPLIKPIPVLPSEKLETISMGRVNLGILGKKRPLQGQCPYSPTHPPKCRHWILFRE